MKRIVLTGGPGAGKTTLLARVVEGLCRTKINAVGVPEAATQIYTELGVRWPDLDHAGRCAAQLAMYRRQVEMEEKLGMDGADVLVLDRGTLDGATYWPDGMAAFWGAANTTHDAELARYSGVIFLETAAAIGVYDGDESNAVRFERPEEAIAAGERLLAVWGRHPRLAKVKAEREFEHKVESVMRVLKGWGIG